MRFKSDMGKYEYKTVKSPTNMIEILKIKRLEERRRMVEENRRKRKLPIVKKEVVLPSMETLIEHFKCWHEVHPNYFKKLEEEVKRHENAIIHTTENGKYVINPEYEYTLTDEQRANMETDPVLIKRYLN
jgi:hypothetical protein